MAKKYTKKQIISLTEEFVYKTMKDINTDVHGFRHVDRVRKWALKIGRAEGDVDLFLLEVSALLHDIGRVNETKKINHYITGEKAARNFLKQLDYFSKEEVDRICAAVYGHGPGGKDRMIKILQDADLLDASGAAVIGRTFSFFADKPFYIDRNSFIFSNWTLAKTEKSYNTRPWARSVVDSLVYAYHLSKKCHTKTAKRIAGKNRSILKDYIKKLKEEMFN